MSILEAFRQPKLIVSEIIGRFTTVTPWWRAAMALKKTVDDTEPDYEWWDKLRRGKLTGYKFGGLFCMPILQTITSHVLGDGPAVTLKEGGDPESDTDPRTYTDQQIEQFMQSHYAFLADSLIDLYGLGDHFLIVNPDASLSVAPPNTVKVDRNPLDYREITKYTITTKTDGAEIEDEYRQDGRTVTVKYVKDSERGFTTEPQVFQFQNLIGRMPVIMWTNDKSANETNGRPIYEPLHRLFSRYDDLIEKSIDGAELMGNPIPVFEGMENIQETINANATAEDPDYTDAEGNTQTRKTIRFDRIASIFVGKGGSFNFKAPPTGFTTDVRDMLKSMFLLVLDYTRIPEFMWGGAIASSKASAEVQWPPFAQYIQYKRAQLEGVGADTVTGEPAQGGLLELIDVWLRTRALVDPRIVVDGCAVAWPELVADDQALQFQKVQWASGTGKVTDKTALELLDIVDDPAAEIEDAAAEAAERQAEAMEYQEKLAAAINEANGSNDQPDERGVRSNGNGQLARAA